MVPRLIAATPSKLRIPQQRRGGTGAGPQGPAPDLLANFHGSVALALAVAGVLLWRLVQVRNLVLPAWVDSVHHTLLVRILLEQGTLPETWGPYLPGVGFYYHFGFHVSAALLAQATGLTGLELGRAVLYAGQLWHAALALGVGLLARQLLGGWNKAVAAVLLVGFVSEMPAFYTAWGRYTLLAGLTLLCFAMATALARRWIALGLLVAATAVTHYYALVLLLLFLGLRLLAAEGGTRLRLTLATAGGLPHRAR